MKARRRMGWWADLQAKWTERRLTRTYMRDLDALEAAMAVMPLAEARRQVDQLLATPSRHVKVTRWTGAPRLHPELGPGLREFFAEYQVVEVDETDQCADVALLEPFDFVEGFLSLGSDDEHTHLAIRPGDDRIFIVADDTDEDHVSDTFASIYHWILFIERRETMLARYWVARGMKRP